MFRGMNVLTVLVVSGTMKRSPSSVKPSIVADADVGDVDDRDEDDDRDDSGDIS